MALNEIWGIPQALPEIGDMLDIRKPRSLYNCDMQELFLPRSDKVEIPSGIEYIPYSWWWSEKIHHRHLPSQKWKTGLLCVCHTFSVGSYKMFQKVDHIISSRRALANHYYWKSPIFLPACSVPEKWKDCGKNAAHTQSINSKPLWQKRQTLLTERPLHRITDNDRTSLLQVWKHFSFLQQKSFLQSLLVCSPAFSIHTFRRLTDSGSGLSCSFVSELEDITRLSELRDTQSALPPKTVYNDKFSDQTVMPNGPFDMVQAHPLNIVPIISEIPLGNNRFLHILR